MHHSGTGHEGRERLADDCQGSPSLQPPSHPTPPTPTSPPSPPCSTRCPPPPPPPARHPPSQTPQFQLQETQSAFHRSPPSTRPSCPAASTPAHPPPSSPRPQRNPFQPHKSSTSPTDFLHFPMLSSTRDKNFSTRDRSLLSRNLTPIGWLKQPNSAIKRALSVL